MRNWQGSSRKGFTLLEVAAIVLLLAILAALVIPSFTKSFAAVSRVRCMTNLKNIHTGFQNYIQDEGRWPQSPDTDPRRTSSAFATEEAYETWWLNKMAPYLPGKLVWQCPVLKQQKVQDATGRLLEMHYTPAMFDANPISPHRWPKQPWAIEITDVHGSKGPLILLPDGSVVNLETLVPASLAQ